jgi:hypothetical protein
VAAWVLNRAALEAPAELEEFAAASGQLEEAQGRALEGEDEGGAEWRAATGREREATNAVLEAAERLARDAGHPASTRAIELVGETLRAAAADPALRDQVIQGRVERERSAATLGTPVAGPPAKRSRRSAKRRDQTQARRDLERLEGELAEAASREEELQTQVEHAQDAVRGAKARLAEGKRRTADLKRQVKAARQRAQGR